MSVRSSSLVVLALVAAIGFTTGCGSDDSSDPPMVAEAKATLSKDCRQGKSSDTPLCDCIADKLAAAGNDAEEILAINKSVNGGRTPESVKKAVGECAKLAK